MPASYTNLSSTNRPIYQSKYFSFQASDVLDLFKDHLGQKYEEQARTLTNLFFAIASPASFRQVVDAIKSMEAMDCPERLQLSKPCGSIAEIVTRLEALESITAVSSLLRRFYLLQLYKQRSKLMQEMQTERHRVRSGGRKGGEPGRISSHVITKMTCEAYPSSGGSSGNQGHPSKAKRTSLQNKLHAAINWNTLVEEFSVGIILLVPVGKDVGIQTQE
jgi:hypothetical protein